MRRWVNGGRAPRAHVHHRNRSFSLTSSRTRARLIRALAQLEAGRIQTLADRGSEKTPPPYPRRRRKRQEDSRRWPAPTPSARRASASPRRWRFQEQVRAYGVPRLQLTQQAHRFREDSQVSGVDVVPSCPLAANGERGAVPRRSGNVDRLTRHADALEQRHHHARHAARARPAGLEEDSITTAPPRVTVRWLRDPPCLLVEPRHWFVYEIDRQGRRGPGAAAGPTRQQDPPLPAPARFPPCAFLGLARNRVQPVIARHHRRAVGALPARASRTVAWKQGCRGGRDPVPRSCCSGCHKRGRGEGAVLRMCCSAGWLPAPPVTRTIPSVWLRGRRPRRNIALLWAPAAERRRRPGYSGAGCGGRGVGPNPVRARRWCRGCRARSLPQSSGAPSPLGVAMLGWGANVLARAEGAAGGRTARD